jgi:hypothetical protein
MARSLCGFNDVEGGARGWEFLIAFGPTLEVNIGFDPQYDGTPAAIPVPGLKAIPALVDTGAAQSCIDNLLAVQLNLPVIDRRAIAGVSGQMMANMYLAQIHVPTLARTITGSFAGVDLKAGGQEHHALIGRTFLRHYRMLYDGISGTVVISDEEPS